jgi:hypothetical protein
MCHVWLLEESHTILQPASRSSGASVLTPISMSAIEAALRRVFQGSGLLGVGYMGVQSCLFTVDGGYRAVMFNRFPGPWGAAGIQPDTYPDGTHFMLPWFQSPHILDVKARPKFEKAVTATKDLQQVGVRVQRGWGRLKHGPLHLLGEELGAHACAAARACASQAGLVLYSVPLGR